MKPLLLSLSTLVALTACGVKTDNNDYFPTQEGIRWQYIVNEQYTGTVEPYWFSIENLGNVNFDDKYFGMPVSVRQTSNGTQYYILKAEDGVFRIAQKKVIEKDPVFDPQERKILPSPEQLRLGTNSWYVDTVTYALRGVGVDTVPDTEDIGFEMEFELVALNETVNVPAGQFKNCVKVVGNASFTLYVDPKLGYVEINVKQTEWYAPGIGMVKLEREEPREIGLFAGGTVTYELWEITY